VIISNSDQRNWDVEINQNGNAAPAPIVSESHISELELDQRVSEFESQPSNASNALNQDVVVYWRLQQDLPGAIELVVHREPADSRGTFMLTATPGVDLQPINEGRDWVFG